MGRKRTHSDEVVVEAIALRESGMSYRDIAAQVGVHHGTVHDWYEAALTRTAAMPDEVARRNKSVPAELYWQASIKAAEMLIATLDSLEIPATWSDARQLAIVAGISLDKRADLIDGRLGRGVTVDNRQQTVRLDGLGVETLRWLQTLSSEERSAALQMAQSAQMVNDGLTIDATPMTSTTGDTLSPRGPGEVGGHRNEHEGIKKE